MLDIISFKLNGNASKRRRRRAKSNHDFKMVDAFDTCLYNFKYRYTGRHMAVAPFKFLPLFRKPKNANIPKRSGVRVMVVDCSKYFP